jgi:hypothetical protein
MLLPPRAQVRNEKAKRFLMNMRRKPGVQLESYFPRADRGAVALLKRMLVRRACSRADDPSSQCCAADTQWHPFALADRPSAATPTSTHACLIRCADAGV